MNVSLAPLAHDPTDRAGYFTLMFWAAPTIFAQDEQLNLPGGQAPRGIPPLRVFLP